MRFKGMYNTHHQNNGEENIMYTSDKYERKQAEKARDLNRKQQRNAKRHSWE